MFPDRMATQIALVSVLSVDCTKGRSASSYRFATNVAAAPGSVCMEAMARFATEYMSYYIYIYM